MTRKGEPTAIDLRSDTVTRPSAAMRRAIAEADVGDDMYGEDPTTNLLQERVAALLGKEAAIFMPTGSMCNQSAIKVHTQPGDDILIGGFAHAWMFESGSIGFVSSVQVTVLPGDGRFDGSMMRGFFKPDNHHMAPTRLVAVENTHNIGGGLVWERSRTLEVLQVARELGLATHLDGARLWNAAVASSTSLRELSDGFDTVSVCLSKGLGAPAGSLLAGSRGLIHKAHRVRRILGGSMRQAGILAAAGLFAIENNIDRLADDHANAKFLARGIASLPGMTVNVGAVQTNMVMVDVNGAPALVAAAKRRGLLVAAVSPNRLRLVTHLDVDRAACTRALEILADLAREIPLERR